MRLSQTDSRLCRGDRWRRSKRLAEAWREGRTGYPIVDAGMRQLEREGFMHNRARMIVASFLTKTMYLDWRLGAAHFARAARRELDYPAPVVDHERAAIRFRSFRESCAG